MRKDTWRLIKTPPASGAWNMAFDEALLLSVGNAKSLPVLRLFAWEPPCLSLGYAQPTTDVNFNHLQDSHWGLVRRQTGGRAILHADELTYSVITPTDEPHMRGGIIESYRRISEALLAALHILGVEAKADAEYFLPKDSPKGAVCFEVPSNYEITVEKKKLIGSAQARRKEGILQHGTLPLFGSLDRIINALNFKDDDSRKRATERLAEHATNLETILGVPVLWEKAATAFETAFADILGLEFVAQPPTQEEISKTSELIQEKFGNDAWTLRV